MYKLLSLILLLAIMSCSNKKNNDKQKFIENLDSASVSQNIVSEEMVEQVIEMMPTPLEISFLLKDSKIKYNNDILNSPDFAENYTSSYSQALNLGVYGTDLGYANVYKQNEYSIVYLGSIQSLADGLSIGDFFDFNTLKKLSTKSNDLDSLLLLTTQNFNSINSFLQKQNRAHLSVLMLAGGWLEALHVLCQVNQNNSRNVLIEKIGEQKIILTKLKELFKFYGQYYPKISILDKSFVDLYKYYDKVLIEYSYGEPTVHVVDGEVVFEDNSSTNITIGSSDVEKITKEIEKIRNNIIK